MSDSQQIRQLVKNKLAQNIKKAQSDLIKMVAMLISSVTTFAFGLAYLTDSVYKNIVLFAIMLFIGGTAYGVGMRQMAIAVFTQLKQFEKDK
jgi:Na+/proline symporter